MDGLGRRIGWPAMLALVLAAGGAAAQETGEAPPEEGGEIVVSDGGEVDGWEGEPDPGVTEAGGGGDVWLGGDDPNSVDGWELEGDRVTAGTDADPSEPVCDLCEVGADGSVGEDLAEAGGGVARSGSEDRSSMTRGIRNLAAGGLRAGREGCAVGSFSRAWFCGQPGS